MLFPQYKPQPRYATRTRKLPDKAFHKKEKKQRNKRSPQMENKQQIDILDRVSKTIKNTSFQLKEGMSARDIRMWKSGLWTALLIIETTKNLIEEEED